MENLPTENLHKKRPGAVTLLASGVLSLAIFNLVGLAQVLSTWEFLSEILPFPPVVMGLFRLLWGGAGLILAWSLWTGQPWAPRLTRLASLFYTAYLWFDRLYLTNPAARTSNSLFEVFITLLLLGFVFWLLSRQPTKLYFGVPYERSAER